MVVQLSDSITASAAGQRMMRLAEDLFPICRSITGDGVRETLRRIGRCIPLETHEIPSGTQVFDWVVPPEWNIRDAYVADPRGHRVIDFRENNLHVVNYSIPIRKQMRIDELLPKLHTLSEHPEWIPYRTSYYAEDWGFCLRHRDLEYLSESHYEVCIDSTLAPGKLTWGEYRLPGESQQEFIFSTHVCHPSLANDNLAGIGVACELARILAAMPRRRFTYRFLFVPGTIGTIAWLATHQDVLSSIYGGLVLALLGHDMPLTYKETLNGQQAVDFCLKQSLCDSGLPHEIMQFEPYGYDERQYNSPGIRLPVGCLMRSRYAGYPEYHTSADNLSRLSPLRLEESLHVCLQAVEVLEQNRVYRNRFPYCEPQLGKRNLYQSLGGRADRQEVQQAMLWLLNLSDGQRSLLEITQRAKLPFASMAAAAALLSEKSVIEECVFP
ncbi:MAG: DUF4910 domain-containing protein [Planctomycetota bacterium]|nr:DUF4910 domain-containing protein [Planctomycetota bacterium]